MPSHLTSTHATHDELLVARLYGGDIDGRDKDRALDLVAACDKCAGYFADFGSIAAAAAAMRTPARPRDFTLTEADGARLRRSGAAPALGRLGRLRLLGRSMAAVGVAGIVLVAAATALAPGGTGGGGLTALPVAAPAMTGAPGDVAALGSTAGPEVVGTDTKQGHLPTSAATASLASVLYASAALAATALPAPAATAAPAASAAPVNLGPAAAATAATTAVSGGDRAATSAGNGATDYGTASFAPAPVPPADHAGDNSAFGGPDGRLVALAGFGVLILLGVLLLVAPRLAARRSGR
jgi:hypothetical protein